jgi:hypothetical protein
MANIKLSIRRPDLTSVQQDFLRIRSKYAEWDALLKGPVSGILYALVVSKVADEDLISLSMIKGFDPRVLYANLAELVSRSANPVLDPIEITTYLLIGDHIPSNKTLTE